MWILCMETGTFIQHLAHYNLWQREFLFFLIWICLTTIKFIFCESPVPVTKLEWTHHSNCSPSLCSLIPEENVSANWGENIEMFDQERMQQTTQVLSRISVEFCYCHIIAVLVPHKHEACLSRQTAILTEAVFSWVRSC